MQIYVIVLQHNLTAQEALHWALQGALQFALIIALLISLSCQKGAAYI